MNLYGTPCTPQQLRRRLGNMDQVAGIKLLQLDAGNERPGRIARVHTGSGLEFTVYLDRGMDIPAASFCGRAMGWRSTTGDVAPQYFEPEGIRWLRSYFGGLLTTCGLTHVGAPAPDSALNGNGLHGRIAHTPAQNVSVVQEWRGKDYVLEISGHMRETSVFGVNLVLQRTLSTRLGATSLSLRDVIINEGFNDTPLMLLYHCNIGWPAVDAGARIIAPTQRIAPRDAEAVRGKETWWKLDPPTHGYKEKVYYHDMRPAKDGSVCAAVVNEKLGGSEIFGVYVKYRPAQLPRFVQWKQMGEQDYVLGLEPCNCGVEGRAEDEKRGLLELLKPGARKIVEIEFGAIRTAAEVRAIERLAGNKKPVFCDHYSDFVKPRR